MYKEVKRLDGIISHFLKAIRPSDPDFKKIKLLDVIGEILRLREKELNAKRFLLAWKPVLENQ